MGTVTRRLAEPTEASDTRTPEFDVAVVGGGAAGLFVAFRRKARWAIALISDAGPARGLLGTLAEPVARRRALWFSAALVGTAALFIKFKELAPRTAHWLMRKVSAVLERRRS